MADIGLLPCDVEEDSTTIITDCKLPFPKLYSKNERFDSGFDSGGLDSETREKEFSDKFSSVLNLHKERHLPPPNNDQGRTSPIESLTYPAEIYQNFDEDGDTPLHLMVIHGNPEYVSSICKNCQDRSYLDSVNNLYQTPLHLAVLMNLPNICKTLIQYKATIDLRDRNGQTPLHIACEQGLIECVKILTESPNISLQNRKSYQDLELMNYEGFTCFHLAVMGGYEEIIEHLCKLKANVNAQDGKSGRTALHYAVEAQNEKLIRLLFRCNANLDITTYAGLTPERLAKGRGYDTIHACLKELGAEEELDEDMSDDYSSDYDDLTLGGNLLQ